MNSTHTEPAAFIAPAANAPERRWQEIVENQVGALRFGSVLISVHEGRVVQIETSVKVRFDKSK